MLNDSFLHYYRIADDVVAFSTMRRGAGVSQGAYGQFNINPYCGDHLCAVDQNRARLASVLNIETDKIILPHQTHDTKVCGVEESFFTKSHAARQQMLHGVDAVITALRKVCIGVSTADCVPILLYDSRLHIVAAIHAGWRGTVNRIVEKAVGVLQTKYGCSPIDIRTVIGPSISKASFEVGNEVYDEFAAKGFHMADIAEVVKGKWHIDLWEANRIQLVKMGIKATNVKLANICTYRECEDFFSARRLTIYSGRIYTGIMMK